jgi:hypothetical protein
MATFKSKSATSKKSARAKSAKVDLGLMGVNPVRTKSGAPITFHIQPHKTINPVRTNSGGAIQFHLAEHRKKKGWNMPSIQISSLKIFNGNTHVETGLLNPFNDPFTLWLEAFFSADTMKMNPEIWITFQIVALRTNEVVEQWVYQTPLLYSGIDAWIVLPTADALGLKWIGSDIFGFRAAIELFSNQGESGLQGVDALAVSDIRWFRFEPVFSL